MIVNFQSVRPIETKSCAFKASINPREGASGVSPRLTGHVRFERYLEQTMRKTSHIQERELVDSVKVIKRMPYFCDPAVGPDECSQQKAIE